MAGTKITLTNDTDGARVLHLGSGVTWYVYARANRGLYLQRVASGVFGPETLVALPVDEIDVIIDPDGTRAWIYFTCDGALRAIEVTTLTETPGTQVFQRGQGWHERIEARAFGGPGLVNVMGFTDELTSAFRVDDGPVEVYPPTISVLDIGSPTQALLVIEPRPVTFGVVNKFRIFRQSDHDGAGWAWYSDLALPPGATQASLIVPRAVQPTVYEWVATAVRFAYPEESAWSNVVRDDQLGESVRSGNMGGAGVGHDYALVDKSPIKISVPTEYVGFQKLGGPGVGHTFGLTDKTPIKISAPTEYVGFQKLGGPGIGHRWTVNGVDIITP